MDPPLGIPDIDQTLRRSIYRCTEVLRRYRRRLSRRRRSSMVVLDGLCDSNSAMDHTGLFDVLLLECVTG